MKCRQGTLFFSLEFIELCLRKVNKKKAAICAGLISKIVAPAGPYKTNLFNLGISGQFTNQYKNSKCILEPGIEKKNPSEHVISLSHK